MVEVFATNVETADDARMIAGLLALRFPGNKINFDLQDCDRILRVEGNGFTKEKVVLLVKKSGFKCEVLE